ncbi:unnamed protein product [Eruca vesicaria subsp. sativa]|uniref:Neprosin PEP catalytic domain-containing protein n=1 Tax=Eruca vesicaria subsp. sativa TaxID=29727 RepID=A0ABC8K997_ERUVS|nr:unnamed protein product [Eruca vesicaria subsp. sativa]
MNVWHPIIESADEFRLGQIWIVSGSYINNDINNIEVGWHNLAAASWARALSMFKMNVASKS